MKVDNIFEFEQKFQNKIHNQFGDVKQYYKGTSCNLVLSKVQVPTLFITSKDDALSHVSEDSIKKCKISC